jgi:hypothetical protein
MTEAFREASLIRVDDTQRASEAMSAVCGILDERELKVGVGTRVEILMG